MKDVLRTRSKLEVYFNWLHDRNACPFPDVPWMRWVSQFVVLCATLLMIMGPSAARYVLKDTPSQGRHSSQIGHRAQFSNWQENSLPCFRTRVIIWPIQLMGHIWRLSGSSIKSPRNIPSRDHGRRGETIRRSKIEKKIIPHKGHSKSESMGEP